MGLEGQEQQPGLKDRSFYVLVMVVLQVIGVYDETANQPDMMCSWFLCFSIHPETTIMPSNMGPMVHEELTPSGPPGGPLLSSLVSPISRRLLA